MHSGDGNFSTSTSSPVSLQSAAITTTTTLTASPNAPAHYGQAITLTATIAPATSGSVSAAGTVTFYDQGVQIGSPVTLASGVAALTLPPQAVGSHSYTAIYSGSSGFLTSTSSPVAYTVIRGFVNLTLPTYTGTYGVSGTTTATLPPQLIVSGEASATGTLTYQFPGFTTQIVHLAGGQATITIPAGLAVGTSTVAVTYSGDVNYSGGTGTMSYTPSQGCHSTVTVNNTTSVYGARRSRPSPAPSRARRTATF